MTIFRTKKDIKDYIASSPIVAEAWVTYEVDEPGGFKEVETELLRLIVGAMDAPDFGEDWEQWLKDNLEELLQDAISIVM